MKAAGNPIIAHNKETHEIHRLPVLVLMPHSACNCRCVMCDIWKANRNKITLSDACIEALMPDIKRLGVKEVALSGGEALLHSNLWTLCRLLKDAGCKISLLSTGLLVEKFAREIIDHCDRLIISLDGDQDTHDAIRNIPNAYKALSKGVDAIKALKPDFLVSARSVILKENFSGISATIESAKDIGLDDISFLAADVDTEAFNREGGWQDERKNEIALDEGEVEDFSLIIEKCIIQHHDEFESGFIVESPDKMRRFIAYFRALLGKEAFPQVSCNAPWASAVIEADGTVRPCFFHAPYGNLSDGTLSDVLNGPKATAFRQQLDIETNTICQGCVCTLNYG